MAPRRDHRQVSEPAPPMPLPVRFNARYRGFDAWLRRHPVLLAGCALALIAGITLARTFPLTAFLPLGGIAVLAAVALALGLFTLGPLAGLAAALWAAWSPLGDLALARLLDVAAPPPPLATIAGPVGLFLLLAGASVWSARRHGWDLRGSFAVALSLALGLAPMG